ncbi:MAG: glycerol-3-phosphate 1-O-acyltransferase PlsY, partial [Pseudomonadota bacterium]
MQILWQMPAMMLGLGYVLGSIPFGLLLTRFAGAGDLRTIGSGNIGATNVLRTGRKGLAVATLLLDLAKGATAVCIARWVSPDDMVIAGAAAVMGHLYPIWLRFRGGKGVATLMGVALALDWRIGAIYAAVWITVLALARISSLGGMLAALSVPIVAALLGRSDLVPIGAALALLVLWRHRDNIARLLKGTEPRIGGKSDAPTDAE